MDSYFGWMDYSEKERRQAMDVIALFGEREARDELGIGTIRDTFAEMLFPGTNTIQTRARYFLFIPWIYLELEKSRVPSNQAAQRARTMETALIEGLIKSNDVDGLIGRDARASLKRLPSAIYWQGLGRWRIRVFPGSQDQYHRALDYYYAAGDRQERNEEGEIVNRQHCNWHSGLPPKPAGFPNKATFALTKREAQYLQDRIMACAPGTFLADMVSREQPAETVRFPWLYPNATSLPARAREQLLHARNFSEMLHGAALIYNLLLAKASGSQELLDTYQKSFMGWTQMLQERPQLFEWERRRFWEVVGMEGARIPLTTRIFVDTWLDRVNELKGTGATLASLKEDPDATNLILMRERTLKGKQARLSNRRALELWRGAAGADQLNYRWSVVQNLAGDILAGLREDVGVHSA